MSNLHQQSSSLLRVIVGDETGLVKVVQINTKNRKHFLSHKAGTQDASERNAIEQMVFSGSISSELQDEVSVCNRSQIISRISIPELDPTSMLLEEKVLEKKKNNPSTLLSLDGHEDDNETDKSSSYSSSKAFAEKPQTFLIPMTPFFKLPFEKHSKKSVQTNNHNVYLNKAGGKTKDSICGMDLIRSDGIRCVSCTRSGSVIVNRWSDKPDLLSSFRISPLPMTKPDLEIDGDNITIDACHLRVLSSESASIAVGGKNVDLSIYDLNSGKTTFKARNVPHDKLDMEVPIWITDLGFLSADSNTIATTTAYGQIRVYDIRAQRRPIHDISVSKNLGHLTSIAVSRSESGLPNVIVSDIRGGMRRVDLSLGREVAKYAGSTGSIRKVSIHPILPYVASVGLDRFLRVYDIESKDLIAEVYLKQRLSQLLFAPTAIPLDKITKDVQKKRKMLETKDDDDLWKSLKTRKSLKSKHDDTNDESDI